LLTTIEIGKARLIKEGRSDIVFLNFGALLSEAKIVAEKLDLTLIDMRFVKPLDEEILLKYLENADMFISLEDGSVMGGAGSAVQEFCSNKNIEIKSKLFGIPDIFIEHASREEMIEDAGINANQILDSLDL
jgi:1-deoxy-D-xylulose-5-phosphate synthase